VRLWGKVRPGGGDQTTTGPARVNPARGGDCRGDADHITPDMLPPRTRLVLRDARGIERQATVVYAPRPPSTSRLIRYTATSGRRVHLWLSPTGDGWTARAHTHDRYPFQLLRIIEET